RRFWRPHPDLDRSATPALPPGGGRPFCGGRFALLVDRRSTWPQARKDASPRGRGPRLGNPAPQPPRQRGGHAERVSGPLAPRIGTPSTPSERSASRNETSVIPFPTSTPATTFTRATMLRDHG